MRLQRLRPTVIALILGVAAPVALAQDLKGASDSPLISRYQGSRLVAQKIDAFVGVDVPTAYPATSDSDTPVSALHVDGQREIRAYVAPAGRTALEVQRNYENALKGAGASLVLACAPQQAACESLARRTLERDIAFTEVEYDAPNALKMAFPILNPGANDTLYATYKLSRGGQLAYVTVITVGGEHGVGTVVDIAVPKAMESGKVAVSDANAIAQGLNAEGKMALYGITFDTGKADIRPESKAQLAEMGKLLKANPALKVFIVGHTDNQGDFDANVALSKRRADAIVAALAHDFGIAAARMRAIGDANSAPVASNATEAGRARNRRVEMVLQ
jgi:outer membrane protein OmpA-like peptidoglycan-associated protein